MATLFEMIMYETDKEHAVTKIVTFRGYQYCDRFFGASYAAKDMIMDIITDGFPSNLWWADIILLSTGMVQHWECPEVGKWSFTLWQKQELTLNF